MNKINNLNRYYEVQEFRAVDPTEDNPAHIVEGYAIVYERATNVGGWFIEIIKRSALIGANLKDVPFFIHHKGSAIPLARSRNNSKNSTLQLTPDDKGLYFKAELDVDNNTDARSLYSAVQRGDISGMSFSFTVKKETWKDLDKDLPTREIEQFNTIYEISALWSPQYEETSIAARDDTLDNVDKMALESARSSVPDGTKNEFEIEKLKTKMKAEGLI